VDAAANLIHQHQAVLGGVVQNIGGFGHLHHKGRAAAGQVRRADAGKDAIDGADLHLLRRDVAADIGQQRNQRGLAHIGTFTAHVRPGDDQHSPLRRQLQRVGDKRLFSTCSTTGWRPSLMRMPGLSLKVGQQ
jgi:hypothetical protein